MLKTRKMKEQEAKNTCDCESEKRVTERVFGLWCACVGQRDERQRETRDER